jgi:hypothetical protein
MFKALSTSDIDSYRKELEKLIPGMPLATHRDTTIDDLHALKHSMASGSEEHIHQTLADRPHLLYYVLPNTGHHGIWTRSKPVIAPQNFLGEPGKVPDFLVAGRSSDGIEWFLVELKRPDHQFANSDATGLSSVANRALTQILKYHSFITEHQGSLRDILKIPEIRTPIRSILVIGTEDELRQNDQRRSLRRIWNSALIDIHIVSYSRFIRGINEHIGSLTAS